MNWLQKILFLSALLSLFATTYFLNWISGVNGIIAGFNSNFWLKIPFEFQIVISGFIIAIIVAILLWIIRD